MQLWLFVARAIAHRHRHDSERVAALLLLLEVAAGKRTSWDDYLDAVSCGLRHRDRPSTRNRPCTPPRSPGALLNLGIVNDHGRQLKAKTVTPQGQAFARAALHS
ncbi:hypothetical protein [Arthrobacter sp. ok909]|uniref:hypothetical protein n=1 Tax=Arthrobacter sp. ok909 TaxID=1761746 RepID=UPI000A7918B1|nr:hypothetical protein [Arthrobacter sp. ok909]